MSNMRRLAAGGQESGGGGGSFPDDYVAAWYASDASGTSQPDRSGNGYVGTATGAAVSGGEWAFDGDGDRIAFGDILDSVICVPDAQFMISSRVYVSNTGSTQTIIGKFGGGDQGEAQRSWVLFILASGAPYFSTYSAVNAAGYRDFQCGSAITFGEDVEVTLSYDGTLDTNNGLDRVGFWIDGVETSVSLAAAAGALTQIVNSAAQLSIGALVGSANTAPSLEMTGGEKRVVVYDRIGTTADAVALASEAL